MPPCAQVPVTNPAYKTFAGDAVVSRLRALTRVAALVCGDYPIETRMYRPGASMPWHQDVKLCRGGMGSTRGRTPPHHSDLIQKSPHRRNTLPRNTPLIVATIYR